jgi:hypothetical protein
MLLWRLVRPACNNFEVLYEVTITCASKDFEVVYSDMISLPFKPLKAEIRLKVFNKNPVPNSQKTPEVSFQRSMG